MRSQARPEPGAIVPSGIVEEDPNDPAGAQDSTYMDRRHAPSSATSWSAEVRHWLDLDASLTDPKEIEGWACFPEDGHYFVARLKVTDGTDGVTTRPTLVRDWPMDAFGGDFDPGIYLGHRKAFDCRLEAASYPVSPPAPPVLADLVPVAERATAARLICQLFQGMVEDRPVVMTVPVAAFSAAGRLPALVAFARAGLPGSLRRRCPIRIFTRHPDRFLAADGASGSRERSPKGPYRHMRSRSSRPRSSSRTP